MKRQNGDKIEMHSAMEPGICNKCKDIYYCPVHENTIRWIEKLDTRLWFIVVGVAISAFSNLGKFVDSLSTFVVEITKALIRGA